MDAPSVATDSSPASTAVAAIRAGAASCSPPASVCSWSSVSPGCCRGSASGIGSPTDAQAERDSAADGHDGAARSARRRWSTSRCPARRSRCSTTGIYARTDGYLKARYVDIGDHVTAGQLLAEIDTPEVDQQLSQAQATLAQEQGQRGEARGRPRAGPHDAASAYIGVGVGTVSKQQIDERTSAVTDAEKAVDAGAGDGERQPGERRPPARAAGLPARLRAVRRRHHGAQRRSRLAHLRRLDDGRRRSSSASRRSIRCASSSSCRSRTRSTCTSGRTPT